MNSFYDKLDELYGNGDLDAVEKFLLDTIAGTGENSTERAGLLNELAGFYRGTGRFAESEDVFGQSLKIFESAGMSATPAYATVLINLAGLFRIMGDADRAINLFFTAMKNLEEADSRESYAYISVLNNLSLALLSKGDLTKALEYASAALDFMRKGSGNEHEIASSLTNIASIRLRQNEIDEAEKSITEALEIYDSMPEPDVHHAAALTAKAVIMSRKGNHRGALNEFRLALELTKKFFGENHEYAICKRNISDICELLGDIPSAIAELSDALRISEKIHGPDDAAVKELKTKLKHLNERQGAPL